jgi:hypothetical protein
MKCYRRMSVVFVLVVMGHGASAPAQVNGRFNRVTTTTRREVRSSPPQVSRVARSAGLAGVSTTTDERESLRPFSAQALAQAQNPGVLGSQDSSWQQESQRPVTVSRVVSQSHNYYPALRPGLTPSRPVTLTSRPMMGIPRICSPTRGPALTGGGHHR